MPVLQQKVKQNTKEELEELGLGTNYFVCCWLVGWFLKDSGYFSSSQAGKLA